MKDTVVQYGRDAYQFARTHGIGKTVFKGIAYMYAALGDFFEERRRGLRTGGVLRTNSMRTVGAHRKNGVHYGPTPYQMAEGLIAELSEDLFDGTFIDFGCGKGRVLVIAAESGFRTIVGVEYSRELCDIARKNIQDSNLDADIDVVLADAAAYEISDDTSVCYFYNPFDEVVLAKVIKEISRSLNTRPRNFSVIYVNPVHGDLFEQSGFVVTASHRGAGMEARLYRREN